MKYLLIDGNSVGRAAHSSTKLTVGDEEAQAIFGTVRTIQALLKSYPNHKPICLWDGRAQWRFDLFPLYKGNRSDNAQKIADRASYHLQKPHITLALKQLGVTQITDNRAEADDLAGYFSRKLGVEGNKVTLVTGDKDWQQLITKNVDWIDHRSNSLVNHLNFKEITGFDNVNQFVDAKCLMGDSSDNIPGIGGIGSVGVVDFFNRFSSVDQFSGLVKLGDAGGFLTTIPVSLLKFAMNETPKESTKFGKMLPMQDAFERNRKLMTLDDYKPNKSSTKVIGGSMHFDENGFKMFCEDWLFKSILFQFDTWISPFKKLGESA